MAEIIIKVFGEGKDLTLWQMAARAVVAYFTALVLIRISGRRTFGKKSSFDITISIILGAVLSRTIVGASAFVPTVGACLALVIIHRLIALAIVYSKPLGKFIKGDRRTLYEQGKINEANLRKCLMTKDDLLSDIRIKTKADNFNNVETVYMENTGELSIVQKDANRGESKA